MDKIKGMKGGVEGGAVAKKISLLEEPQIKCRIIGWYGLTSAVQGQRGREGNPNIQEYEASMA